MANFNSMQSNMGITPGITPGSGMNTPSPAETAARLSQQALQQLSLSHQQLQNTLQYSQGSPSVQVMGNQVQTQLTNIQNSLSAMGVGGVPWMPSTAGMQSSPLTMTPSAQSTGQYSAPTAPPIPPVPVTPQMPMVQTPFTPQLPSPPMFRTAWEQETEQRQSRADSLYNFAMQTPNVAGQGMAYGAAALMGSRMLGGAGGMGRLAGAAGGAAIAGMSGVAQGAGDMMNTAFAPMRQTHEMGAAIQQMSNQWVIGGQDVGRSGQGLGSGPSIQLARNIGKMTSDSGFQKETGGMFNRQDMMNIMADSGRAGLMDQSQDISAIQRNLRLTARTIKEFMELTNDPDVSSVIRNMGRLRDVGMDVTQMRGAAANLRLFARSAGLSVSDVSGAGMGGAQTFAAAGLAPDVGFTQGMHATSVARQAIASGTYNARELAMQGGVSGIATRNVQAQAAMMSSPSVGMAVGQYTPTGGWQMDPEKMQGLMNTPGAMGAKALLKQARENMQDAYATQGGEALAAWPLQQRQVASQAAASMSPQQQMALRYKMAADTGAEMGLEGAGAFALGARRLFGEGTATQMMKQGANPEFWRMQRQDSAQQLKEIAYSQYEKPEGVWGRAVNQLMPNMGGMSGLWDKSVEAVTDFGSSIMEYPRSIYQALGDMQDKDKGILRRRRRPGSVARSAGERRMLSRNMRSSLENKGESITVSEDEVNYAGSTIYEAQRRLPGGGKSVAGGLPEGVTLADVPPEAQGVVALANMVTEVDIGGVGEVMGEMLGWAGLPGIAADFASNMLTGRSLGDWGREGARALAGNLAESNMGSQVTGDLIRQTSKQAKEMINLTRQSSAGPLEAANRKAVAATLGVSEIDVSGLVVGSVGALRKDILKNNPGGVFRGEGTPMGVGDIDRILTEQIQLLPGVGPAKAKKLVQKMKSSGELDSLRSKVIGKVRAGQDDAAAFFNKDTQKHVTMLHEIQESTDAARDAKVQAAEAKIGTGIFGGKDEWEAARKTFEGLTEEVSALGVAGLVAELGGDNREKELFELFKKSHPGGDTSGFYRWRKDITAKAETLTDKQVEMLQNVDSRAGLKDINKLAAGKQWNKIRNAQADTLEILAGGEINTNDLNISDPRAVSKRFTPEMREEMMRKGDEFAGFATYLDNMDEMAKKQGGKQSRSQILHFQQKLDRMGGPGEGEVTESVAGVARGSAAERARASGKVASAAQAKYTEALKTFADAAPIFLKASEALAAAQKDPSVGEAADALLTAVKALPGKIISGDDEDKDN